MLLLGSLGVIVFAFNVIATLRVHKSGYFEPVQKKVQYGVIWLIPAAGALMCYLIAADKAGSHSGKYSENNTQYDLDPWATGTGDGSGDYLHGDHSSD